MGHFQRGPAPGAGRAPGTGRAGGGAARGGAVRAAGARDPAAVVAGAGHRPGDRQEHGRRGVRAARRGGVADRPAGIGHPGGRRRRALPGSRPRAPGRQRGLRPGQYDLRPGSPDLSAFPRAGWLSAARKALSAAPSHALGYGDPRGLPELRAVLAGYLARARGVRASPDRIVVCSGFTQGLALLCQVLPGAGVTRIAVEEYGLPGPARTLAASGLAPVMLGVDDGGAILDPAPGAEAMLLTPAHQFPLGSVLSPRRRADAARWAAGTGGLVIEDDYDGEFRYDRQPVGALQALAPEHVVYAGTASKTLAPGLRLGWLVLPARLVDAVADAKARADAHTSSLEQLTLAEFITSGAYDRHVRRARLELPAPPRPAHRRARPARPRRPPHRDRGRAARGRRAAPRHARAPGHRARGRPGRGHRGTRRLRTARPRPRARAGHRLRHPARPRLHHRAGPAHRGDPGPVGRREWPMFSYKSGPVSWAACYLALVS